MNLKEYFLQLPYSQKGEFYAEFASKLNVSTSSIAHWMHGRRKVSPPLVFKIEKITSGAVTRHDLRPDIYPREE